MNDEDLIGYILGALAPEERAAVASHLHATPEAVVRLEQLRLAFAPLEADREPVSPPTGLAVRTLARVAAHIVAFEPRQAEVANPLLIAEIPIAESLASTSALPRAPRDEPESRVVGGRLRLDLVVAAGIALFACGILFSAVSKIRAQNQMLACQNNLRTIHAGLTGYADTHQGRYPQVGVGGNATAETFAATLADSGQVPTNFRPCCPAAPVLTPPYVGYTYTLGYRAPGGDLYGLRRPDGTPDEFDLVPISADFPTADAAPTAGPTCPHTQGMNVLFVGGNVRITNSALVGPGGDDIYRNVFGAVAAGADRADVVLGRPGDRP